MSIVIQGIYKVTGQVDQQLPVLSDSTGKVLTVASSNSPSSVLDAASTAVTSTVTSAAITPSFGLSYSVNIPVTAVSGTTPTLDVNIQESDDGGTNWFTVYSFHRITATGIYRSPMLPVSGNQVRYVQTVGGGTPSFTYSINRLQSSLAVPMLRQLIDRTISLTTLNSTTPSLVSQDGGNYTKLSINIGAATTAPALTLEGSDDGGVSWTASGTVLTAIANSTVVMTTTPTSWGLFRARVSTAGTGVTAGYVLIKGHD